MGFRLHFLGAAGCVTGSRFLVTHDGDACVLVDAGLFQGLKKYRQRNWAPFLHPPGEIQAIVLTHGHLDHCGILPRLVKEGFTGRVFCTAPTKALASLILADSARLQEEGAAYANRKGFSKHKPALPLYSSDDADAAISLMETVPYEKELEAAPGIRARMRSAGHILGSASVLMTLGEEDYRVLFSGDLGRSGDPLMAPPFAIGEPVPDEILVESTYGDREHSTEPVDDLLSHAVQKVVDQKGTLLIPAFAVGRSTLVLHRLEQLEKAGRIPEIPIYLDSPMAVSSTELYRRFAGDPNLAEDLRGSAGDFFPIRDSNTFYIRTRDESILLNQAKQPCIIVSSSGMLTGGRVLHHLKRLLPEKRNVVMLVGYQAVGTRGWRLQEGEKEIRIFGRNVKCRAEVLSIGGFSAHGDRDDLLEWLRSTPRPPKRLHLVHGEKRGLEALRKRLDEELGWPLHVPDYRDSVDLG